LKSEATNSQKTKLEDEAIKHKNGESIKESWRFSEEDEGKRENCSGSC